MGYDCLCAYLHPPDDPGFSVLADRARQWEAPLISVPDNGPFDLKILFHLLRICREHRVAIWHGHEYKSNVLGLLLRRFWPMKLVTTVHGWGVHEGRAPLYNGIDRRTLRFYDQVICVSEDLKRECLAFGVRPDRSELVHNAIDTKQYSRMLSAAQAKQSLGAPPQGLLVGALGRLSDEKRFDLLIQAIARLVQRGHDLHLWIAGEGPARAALELEINRQALSDRVKLLGMVADPRTFLQALDIFVLSSVREGLPNAVLEAMAMQTPVVATRIAGIPALLDDGRLGELVEPGSVEALTDAIERLSGDANRRQVGVQAARRKIEDVYSFERRMQRIATIYDRLLGRTIEPANPFIKSA
jgi:glycosyltransferase involved in cell wall biosynthesis